MAQLRISSNLPRSFAAHPRVRRGDISGEFDVRLTPHARLSAKVLIFRSCSAMRRFWRDALALGELGKDCRGAVNALSSQGERLINGEWKVCRVHADERYFCVVGLVRGYLTPEIICHEAVHAGFCYAKRVARTPFAAALEFDEERVAYPAGIIAAGINDWLRKEARTWHTD